MNEIYLTFAMMKLLGNALEKCTFIQALRIKKCTFQENFAETLGNTLAHGTQLQEFELSSAAQMNDQVIRVWNTTAPRFGSRLRVLRLTGCNLTLHGLDSLASTMLMTKDSRTREMPTSWLTELDLSDNPLGNGKPQAFSILLSSSPNLKILCMARCGGSLDWLPGVLMRSCQNVLRVLDISGSSFGRSVNMEWSMLFAETRELETLRLDNCRGLYFAETLRVILNGLGRLTRRPTNHKFQLQLSQITIGESMHSLLSTVLRAAVASVITHLDLSQFDFAEAALNVFQNLESCVTLESLKLNGPWKNVEKNTQKQLMLSLSTLLQKPDCCIKLLSIANVGLRSDVLYLICDLLNFTSLCELDLSGNQFGLAEIGNGNSQYMGEAFLSVSQILARLLSATDYLTNVAFDNNNLTLDEIDDLVQVAEHQRRRLILQIPFCDLAKYSESNPEKCKDLVKRIENLHERDLRNSTDHKWEQWENGEKMQATIQCIDRLCMNTRHLQEELNKPIKNRSISDLKVGADDGNSSPRRISDGLSEEVKKGLVDGVRTQILLHEFATVGRDMNKKFLEETTDSVKANLQSRIEDHLNRLSSALLDKTHQLCPNQSEICPDLIKGQLSRVQDLIRSDVPNILARNLLPELEEKLNAMSSDLATAIYDAIARNVIDGLDQLHQQLLEKIRPKRLPKSPGVRKPVRVRWLEARSSPDGSSRSYPLANHLPNITPRSVHSAQFPSLATNGNELLRFRGLVDVRPLPRTRTNLQRKSSVDNDDTSLIASTLSSTSDANIKKVKRAASLKEGSVVSHIADNFYTNGATKSDINTIITTTTTKATIRQTKSLKTVDMVSASTHPSNSSHLDHAAFKKTHPEDQVKSLKFGEVDQISAEPSVDQITRRVAANVEQNTQGASLSQKAEDCDDKSRSGRLVKVEVGSVRSVHPNRSSPKVDSFHLEPMALRRAESLHTSKPRQTALDDRITTITREDPANLEKPISYRTAVVSQYPGHGLEDTLDNKNRAGNKTTEEEDNAKEHSPERDTRAPRRGSSEPSLWLEEAFMKELYYTPCVADSSESDGDEAETWGPGSHMTKDRKRKTPSKSKPISENSEWFRNYNTDGEYPNSCPEKDSPIQRFQKYQCAAGHPQRLCGDPPVPRNDSQTLSDWEHSTVPRTILLPEIASENHEIADTLMDTRDSKERSKQFTRLKLFFEENSTLKPQTSQTSVTRGKTQLDRRKNTSFTAGDFNVNTSTIDDEDSDLSRLTSIGNQSGVDINAVPSDPGRKPPQLSMVEIKYHLRPPSTSTLSLSPTPPPTPTQTTTTMTTTDTTVVMTTATSSTSQSISTSGTVRSPPAGQSESSLSSNPSRLSTFKNVMMRNDPEISLRKPATRVATYAALDTIPTRDEHLFTSKTAKPDIPYSVVSGLGPKLTPIGYSRPKRPKTRPGSRASISGLTTTIQTTDDEDLFRGFTPGWDASVRDNTSQVKLSRGSYDEFNSNDDTSVDHVPDSTGFKLISSMIDSDVETDTEGRRTVRFRGVPMPGLVGPNAQSLLAEIKQKNQLRSHETRSASKPVEVQGPVSELQRAISSLRSSKPPVRVSGEKGSEPVMPLTKRS